MFNLKMIENEVFNKVQEFVKIAGIIKPATELEYLGFDHNKGIFKYRAVDAEGMKMVYRVYPFYMSVTEEHEEFKGQEWSIGNLS